MIYKALVTHKVDKTKVIIESECNSKAEFIKELRANGYSVNPLKVKTKEVFEFIMNNTNVSPEDWKKIKKVF